MTDETKKPIDTSKDKEPKLGKFDWHPNSIQWDDPEDQTSWNQALVGTPFEVPGAKKPKIQEDAPKK